MMRTPQRDCGCCTGIEVAVPMSRGEPARPVGAHLSRRRLRDLLRDDAGAPVVAGVRTAVATTGPVRISPAAGEADDARSVRSVDRAARRLGGRRRRADFLPGAHRQRRLSADTRSSAARCSSLAVWSATGCGPGLSASVKLAFTTATGFTGDIPAGTRAQSIPNAGESPQFFETSAVLTAPRYLERLAAAARSSATRHAAGRSGATMPAPSDARVVVTMYFDGPATNLEAVGSPVLQLRRRQHAATCCAWCRT